MLYCIVKDKSSTSAQILVCGAIHAQSKEKQTFISQNKVTPADIDFTDRNTKKYTLPLRYLGGLDSGPLMNYPTIEVFY